LAIRYCLKEAGADAQRIDHVAVARNPYARLATKLFYSLRMPSFARERAKVMVKFNRRREALAAVFDAIPQDFRQRFHRVSTTRRILQRLLCFSVRPVRAAIRDGLGDFRQHHVGNRSGKSMEIDEAIRVPHSAGLYYSAGDAISWDSQSFGERNTK